MNKVVSCLSRHGALKLAQAAILVLPLCFTGCFESSSAANRNNKGQLGIAPMARYFTSGQSGSPEKGTQDIESQFQALQRIPMPDIPQLSKQAEELGIALPAILDGKGMDSPNPFRAAGSKSGINGSSGQGHITGIGTTAQLFNNSFSTFFSSVFARNKREEPVQPNSKEDLPNPFTELRKKLDADSEASAATDDKTEVAKAAPKASEEKTQENKATDPTAVSTGDGVAISDRFLIIGDFAGSGTLSSKTAARYTDAVFASDDGDRGFNLYVNVGTLEQLRAFYVDDLNQDGITDLLVTSGASLFGGILLGDGKGGYRLADTFLTGYEPVVSTIGPIQNGMHCILTMNIRNGVLTTFALQDHYRAVQSEQLPFLPDYLLHLVAQETSRDYVMASRIGGTQEILAWGDNSLLQPVADKIGGDPVVVNTSLNSDNLQLIQVGNYASLIMTRHGYTFNVANLHVLPGTYLVIGDFYRRGSQDVAVGILNYFKKNSSQSPAASRQ